VALIIVGIVSMSETVLPTKTSLAPATLTVRVMGPVIGILGAIVLMAARRIPRKLKPSPQALTVYGALTALAPGGIWGIGAAFAEQDSAFWAPAVAAALLLLTVPGLGMAIGGARRLGRHAVEPTRPAQAGPKIKRRK
jgi:hypothetical protein